MRRQMTTILLLIGMTYSVQSEGCPLEETAIDLIIMLDTSSSVKTANWNLLLDFISKFISEFMLLSNGTEIGVFSYSSNVDKDSAIFMNSFANNTTELINAVTKLPYMGGGTQTGKALRYARTTMLDTAHGNRRNAGDYLLLFTDGKASDESVLFEEASVLMKSNITIYVVGIGNKLKMEQLKAIAGSQERLFIFEKGFTKLNDIFVSSLVSVILKKNDCTRFTVSPPVCLSNETDGEKAIANTLLNTERELKRAALSEVCHAPETSQRTSTEYIEIERSIIRSSERNQTVNFSLLGKYVSLLVPPTSEEICNIVLQVALVKLKNNLNSECETQAIERTSNSLKKTYFIPPSDFLSAFGLQGENRRKLDLSIEWESVASFKPLDKEIFSSKSWMDPVLITDTHFECSFIDEAKQLFSSDGCKQVVTAREDVIGCSCNHTTTFATLLSATVVKIPETVKILSYVMELFSVVCLLATMVLLFVSRKKIKNPRTVIQINLTISLLLFHIFNLFHDLALNDARACLAIVICIHYFTISSGTWMVAEGVGLFVKTSVNVMELEKKKNYVRGFQFILGWVCPAVIVGIAVIIGLSQNSYLDVNAAYLFQNQHQNISNIPLALKHNQCWLSSTSGIRLYGLIIPVAVCVLFNICIIVRVAVMVTKMSLYAKALEVNRRSATEVELEAVKDGLKAAIVLFPVLGIPWILGFFIGVGNYTTSLVFLYLNSIVNGLQGFLLFIVYCIIGSQVRNALFGMWKRQNADSRIARSVRRTKRTHS